MSREAVSLQDQLDRTIRTLWAIAADDSPKMPTTPAKLKRIGITIHRVLERHRISPFRPGHAIWGQLAEIDRIVTSNERMAWVWANTVRKETWENLMRSNPKLDSDTEQP
jgi:hypothetical protein